MTFLTVMEWIGTVAFAMSGAIVAIRRGLDYYGICFLAIITAIGGGILRDILVNRQYPASLANPLYAIVSVITAWLVILGYRKIEKLNKLNYVLLIADGFGLAAFTAIGAKVAVITGHNDFYSVITMAVLTGTFGGVMRDVFAQEVPLCFRKEVYAVASIVGAIAFKLSYNLVGTMYIAVYTSFAITLAVRLVAIFKNWHLGVVKLDGK